jgi:hypothetical protein
MADTIEKEAQELGYGTTQSPPVANNRHVGEIGLPNVPFKGNASRISHTVGLPKGDATVENIKTYLKIKSARIKDLAIHFNVAEEAIRRIVDDKLNGIIIGDRGWLHCDDQQALPWKPGQEGVMGQQIS